MTQILDSIQYHDVVNYWKNFFPELKTENDINELLNKTSELSFNELEEKWNSVDDKQEYIAFIEDLFSNIPTENDVDDIINALPQHDFPYINFLTPLFKPAFEKTKHKFDELDIIQDKSHLFQSIIIGCYRISYKMSFRTLILETNIARNNHWLEGDTPVSRANYFKFVLLKDNSYLKSLYLEYSSLINLLKKSIENFITYIYDIIIATKKEKSKLEMTLQKELGNILHIETSFGDSHNGGKTVAVINFTTGEKLVIKPRNMDLEQRFNEFIEEINHSVEEELLNLRYAKVHSSKDFGWMEFIEYNDCDSQKQVENFYNRIGQYLCILYSLNAKDFHHENLIAFGEHPVLIDLEALLHVGSQEKEYDKDNIHGLASRMIGDSVYSIYLLPTRTLYNESQGQVNTLDIGGVGANTKQLSPFRSSKIADMDTDSIKVERNYGYIDIESNNPRLNNEIINSSDYIDQIQYGFRQMYIWILKNKKTYIQMVEKYFKNVKTRVICKPTFLYSNLLSLSYHPDLLRESIHREVYFNRIGFAEFFKNPGKIALSEYEDLLQGDIPYFSIKSDEVVLTNSNNSVVDGFKFEKSPLHIVLSKISDMNTDDLQFQTSIIDYTFMHTIKKETTKSTGVKFISEQNAKITNSQKYLEIAKEIGNKIIKDSIVNTSKTERTWFGLMVVGKEEVYTRFSSVEDDLYKGNSGIALFLAYLAKTTQDNKYKEAAKQTIKPSLDLLKSLDDQPDIPLDLGAFTGISGIIYSVFHIGNILEIDEYKELAYSQSEYLVRNIQLNNKFELISGSAGALGTLISMYENTCEDNKKEQLITRAKIVAKHIVKNVTRYNNFLLWGSIEEKDAYTGFAHGSSGITAALARYYKYNRDPEIEEVIKSAIEFENSLFSTKENNWKMNIDKHAHAIAWCHGAPGILLNRAILLKHGFEVTPTISKDIEHALHSTMNLGFGAATYVLCHGDTGNLGAIYQLAAATNDEELRNKCDSFLENLFNNYIIDNWDDNVFRSVNIYGLMTGLSGLGYFLLKYGCKEEMQDVLWLE
ncbi:type 2 lanthipeptide synthetase LanM family protein [Niallia sp. BSM11]|uniref:type 2 lanthipeptide synthetase LanM family protein n=1 Tax=Niallia sp. BSM11 TaxID=3391576 RepID=UPI0039847BED